MPDKKARIIGTGHYLPEKVLTNQDLEKMVETSDEWIVTRTGMKERRIAGKDEYTSDLGYHAALQALEKAGILASDLDLVIFGTITPDYVFPSTACLIQSRLQANKAGALDIQAACSGYIYGLSMAKAYIESGLYRNVLVIAADKLSSIVNYKDRNTCVLFGDGASACVVSDKGQGLLLREVCLGSDGEQSNLLIMPAGGSRIPASQESVLADQHYIQMGKETFKHAVRRMEHACKECLDQSGLAESDISWLIPHQANMRIFEAIARRFDVPMEKVYVTLHKYGNTSASSVGIALNELLSEQSVKEGDNLLLTAFGAGLTWGAALLTKTDNHV